MRAPFSRTETDTEDSRTAPVAKILGGSLASQVARFGLPLALGMGLQTTFNLVDAYIIARLPHEVAGPSLGAIGICDQLAALGTIVSYGISVATGALLSRKLGEGDVDAVRRVAWQSLLCVLGLGLVFALVAALGAEAIIVHLVGAKGRVAELGVEYLRVMVGGGFSIFLLLHLTTIQRALGSSKTPVSLLLGANVANLVLAVLLVYGPGPSPDAFAWAPPIARALGIPRLELMGAAWATIAARLLALVPATWIIVRRFDLFRGGSRTRFDFSVIRSIASIAWPTSVQLVVRIVAMLSVHSMVARAFTTNSDQSATTALGIVFRLETMALFVALGWGSAAQSFMGWSLGANDGLRAKQSGYYAAAYSAATLLCLVVVYVAFGGAIVRFFDAEATVVDTGVAYLTVIAPSYVALGVAIVLGSAMQGAGATRQTLLLDLGLIFGLTLPLAVAVVVGGGSPGRLWQCIALSNWVQAIVYFASYRRGAYLKIQL